MKKLCITFIAIAIAGATSANATSVKAFSTHDLVKESATVLTGKVLSNKAVWNAEKTIIYTETRVAVDEQWVGRTQKKTITVRQMGGQIGEVSLLVPGTVKLHANNQVVLFLRNDAKFHYLVGMAQGHYFVRKEKGKVVVTRELHGINLIRKQLKGRVGHRPAPVSDHSVKPEKLSYDSLKRTVQRYAKVMGK